MLLSPRSARISLLLHFLLFLIVAVSALNYWKSTNYALQGNWFIEYYKQTTYINLVPTWQKLAKDVLALLLLAASLFFQPTNPNLVLGHNRSLGIWYALCLMILGVAIARSALFSSLPITTTLATLRPFIFVAAIFVFCHRHLYPSYFRWVLEATNGLALIQVYYTWRQRDSAILHNGLNWLHSGSARSVGTFTEPNTLGLFLALVIYVNLLVLPPHRGRLVIALACAIGSFFTGSRTAQLLIAITLAISLYQRFRQHLFFLKDRLFITIILLPSLLLFGWWILGKINTWSGRGASSSASGGRLEILMGYINQTDPLALLFGQYLSFGSNLVRTLNLDQQGDFFLADSTWAALLAQFGFLGLFVVIGLIFALWSTPLQSSLPRSPGHLTQERTGLLIYLIFSSFTIILMEFYAALPILIPLLFPWYFPKFSNSSFHNLHNPSSSKILIKNG